MQLDISVIVLQNSGNWDYNEMKNYINTKYMHVLLQLSTSISFLMLQNQIKIAFR